MATIGERIKAAGWRYVLRADCEPGMYGWLLPDGPYYGSDNAVADSIDCAPWEVRYERCRLENEHQRANDPSLPILEVR